MYTILLAAMIFISAALAGLFAPPFPQNDPSTANKINYFCCNTGDGDDCKADPSGDTIQYHGDTYELLKSNVYMHTFNPKEHYDVAQENGKPMMRNGEYVFVNVIPAEKTDPGTTHPPGCNRPAPDNGHDWIYVKKDPREVGGKEDYSCQPIPDDLLLYLCRSDNPPGKCEDRNSNKGNVALDVWINMKDLPADGSVNGKFPFLAQCDKPPIPTIHGEQQIVFQPSPGGNPNLQLRTFKFIQPGPEAQWLNPYCKPAIYLYPDRKTEINVSIAPQGKMLLTIPPYPKTGWNVIADPDGQITYQNKTFDYLYYEASIPDKLIGQPKSGYVISYDTRQAELKKIVTDLGLNEKETAQFTDYWTKILPKSPYYFVGVVPQTTLNDISPLFITPKPDHLLRVTLYFQPMKQKVAVTPPSIANIDRSDFTAVEWGGIFKQDKDHPFSCFM